MLTLMTCRPSSFTRLVLAAALVLPCRAAAQSPGSSEESIQQTPAQQFASGPMPGTYQASITFGGQTQDGRTATKGVTLNGIVAYRTRRNQLLRFDTEVAHARYRPAPGAPHLTVENNALMSLTFIHGLNRYAGFMVMGDWKRDTILGLNYRARGVTGIGLELVQTPRMNLMVGPGIAVGREDSVLPNAPTAIVGAGVIQSFSWHPSRTSTIEEYFGGFKDMRDAKDSSLTFNASFLAQATRYVGLKIYYKYSREGVFPEATGPTQRQFGAGVTFTFPGT